MLLGSLAIATMATLTHGLADRCHWELVAAVRAGLALVIAVLLVLQARAHFVVWRPRTLWLRSLSGTVSLMCMFYALPRLPISDVLTLMNMFPVWVALLSWPVLGALPSRGAWLAIAVGICGVVLVAQPHFAEAKPLPAIVVLIASVSTSIAMLGLHQLQGIDPRAIVVHFSGVSFLACLAVLALDPADSVGLSKLTGTTLLMLAGVGICATIGQLFLTMAFAAGPPARVSVVALTQVVFAIIFDTIIWQHAFGLTSLIGIALVLAPTAWLLVTQRRPRSEELSLERPGS